MSESPSEKSNRDKSTDLPTQTESLERYDLTGQQITKWTVDERKTLWRRITDLLSFGCKKVASKTLPGNDETIGSKASKTPGKVAEHLEAILEEKPIDNELKSAQTETEFLKQELLRQQIEKTKAETAGQKLNNAERQIQIAERLQEITKGKTDVYLDWDDDQPSIIFGRLPEFEPTELTEKPDEHDTRASLSQLYSLDVLQLSTRTKNLLHKQGITSVLQISKLTANKLINLDGVGIKTFAEIEDKMKEIGYPIIWD